MIIKYEHYPLKMGVKYPFDKNEYSELLYEGDDSIFNIVNPYKIIVKDISQLLDAGYFDQQRKDVITNIFNGYRCYFIYDNEEEKYCMRCLFTEEEKNSFSKQFADILLKITNVVYDNEFEGYKYISLEDMDKASEGTILNHYCYFLGFSKNRLETL